MCQSTGQYQLRILRSVDSQYFILYSQDRHPYLLEVEFLRDHIATYITPIEYERGLKAMTLVSGNAMFSYFPEKGMESAKETNKIFLLHSDTRNICVRLPKNTIGHSSPSMFDSDDENNNDNGDNNDDDDDDIELFIPGYQFQFTHT